MSRIKLSKTLLKTLISVKMSELSGFERKRILDMTLYIISFIIVVLVIKLIAKAVLNFLINSFYK